MCRLSAGIDLTDQSPVATTQAAAHGETTPRTSAQMQSPSADAPDGALACLAHFDADPTSVPAGPGNKHDLAALSPFRPSATDWNSALMHAGETLPGSTASDAHADAQRVQRLHGALISLGSSDDSHPVPERAAFVAAMRSIARPES
jgi:hypothetical protein